MRQYLDDLVGSEMSLFHALFRPNVGAQELEAIERRAATNQSDRKVNGTAIAQVIDESADWWAPT